MDQKVENYFQELALWKTELQHLRNILLECGLQEELKWGAPCYTFQNKNIAILGAFKKHCVISFFKGSLLQDSEGLLSKPGANTQAARIISIDNVNKISSIKSNLRNYIFEAIEIEKGGQKIEKPEPNELIFPEELLQAMHQNNAFKEAFEKLTPGRQRAYIIHFTGSEQSKTRIARIEKYKQRILDGFGFNDCVCGLSKKMPGCDGSHKYK